MKKLRICMICNGAPHYRAGIFRLMDQEFDMDWFMGPGYDNIKQLPLSFFKQSHPITRKYIIKRPICYQKGEIRQLLSSRYDVIISGGEVTCISTWIGMIFHALLRKQTKVYCWTHGILRERNGLRRLTDKFFFSLYEGVFTYGQRAKEIMINQGFRPEGVFPIHNSLDYHQQKELRDNFTDVYSNHFNNNYPVILFIGRLTPIKKLDQIIDAIWIMRNKGRTVNCIIIGDGPVKNNLQDLVNDYGLKELVWFYGPTYNEKEKSELITNADLCVAPGNIGLTAMDSMVYGTPACTMDNFDFQMPEHEAIKEGKTGFFFKENDPDDMATKIMNWFDIVDREKVRQNCYDEIDNYWTPEYQIEVLKANLHK